MLPLLPRVVTAASRRLLRVLFPARPPAGMTLVRLGGAYGAWTVPEGVVRPDWVVYCAGVGEDISFDLTLIARYGCEVHAFDPTPRSAVYVREAAADEPRFHFCDWGLWSHDDEVRFYAPRDPAHVSHSIVNLQGTDDFFVGTVRSLASTMRTLGHDRLDLLKLDIEGAEHAVLDDLVAGPLRPQVLCVEFDQPVPPHRVVRTIRRLRSAGYRIAHVSGWDYTFVRGRSAAPGSSPAPRIAP